MYAMPPINIGDLVWWYRDGDKGSGPQAGICTRVGSRNISVSVFSPGLLNMETPDGVYHVDDPRLKEVQSDTGGWDYHPSTRQLRELFAEPEKKKTATK